MKQHKSKYSAFDGKYKLFKCNYCEKTFFSKYKSRKHERKVHRIFKTEKLGNGKHKSCKPRSSSIIDDLPFKSDKFSDHVKTHKFGRKKFKCDECGKEFHVRLTYKAHMKDHTVVDGNLLCD